MRHGTGGHEAQDRHAGGAPGGGDPAEVPAGQGESGQARHRQRAVLEAAALGADGKGRGGRQSRRPPAGQRMAGELYSVQARGRHGQLSGADGTAQGAGRPGGGGEADPHSAGDPAEQPVQEGVCQGVVEQAEVRLRRVRRVLGRPEAPRAGGHRHPQHGCAESVLGAGGAGHTGVGALLLHGAGARSPAGAGVPPAGGEAGARRRGAGEPLSLRRQGGHLRPVAGGGLVLPYGGGWASGFAVLQVRGGDGAVRHGE